MDLELVEALQRSYQRRLEFEAQILARALRRSLGLAAPVQTTPDERPTYVVGRSGRRYREISSDAFLAMFGRPTCRSS